MTSEEIDTILRKNRKLAGKRAKLEAMKDGAYCWHGSWGFGRIKSYDSSKGKLVIDFEGKPGHMMDPVFCVDKLDILSDDNLIVRFRNDRENVEKEMKNPADFVERILAGREDRSVSSVELENLLKQLFGYMFVNALELPEKEFEKKNKAAEKAYRAWWSKAKEALFRDPRVACPKTKTGAYVLRQEGEEKNPEQEVIEEYFINREPKKKILLAERLFKTVKNGGDVGKIMDKLPQIKEELTEAIKNARSLNDADKLHGIWVRNDLIRYLYEGDESKVEEIAPRSKDIIKATDERDPKEGLTNLAKNLPSAYLERFLDLLTRIYKEHWRDVIMKLLQNSEGRFTNECIDFLLDWDVNKESRNVKGEQIPDDGKKNAKGEPLTSRELIKISFKRWLDEQTLHGPVILWIVKNRNASRYKDILEDIIGQDLLSALLSAVDDESLQRETVVSTARIPLADALSDDKSLISDMLKNSTPENARDLAQSLLLNQGFEDLTKKSILARFIAKFPNITSLVASKTVSKSSRLIVSEWSMQAHRDELEDILSRQLPENTRAIEAAKELGDLSENSEYKMAREHNAILTARLGKLQEEIKSADVTDFTEATNDVVGIGSVVTMRSEGGKTFTCTILGAWDGDTDRNIYSYQAPLSMGLMSHKVGEKLVASIGGKPETWEITKIQRYVDLVK